jgi:hypothetical protein
MRQLTGHHPVSGGLRGDVPGQARRLIGLGRERDADRCERCGGDSRAQAGGEAQPSGRLGAERAEFRSEVADSVLDDRGPPTGTQSSSNPRTSLENLSVKRVGFALALALLLDADLFAPFDDGESL